MKFVDAVGPQQQPNTNKQTELNECLENWWMKIAQTKSTSTALLLSFQCWNCWHNTSLRRTFVLVINWFHWNLWRHECHESKCAVQREATCDSAESELIEVSCEQVARVFCSQVKESLTLIFLFIFCWLKFGLWLSGPKWGLQSAIRDSATICEIVLNQSIYEEILTETQFIGLLNSNFIGLAYRKEVNLRWLNSENRNPTNNNFPIFSDPTISSLSRV